MLELGVVPGQRFVHGEIQQHPVVVLAQLRFGLLLGHLGINGGYPVFRFLLWFQRRRAMKSGDRKYPAQKNRGGHDAHVVTVAQGQQILLHDESADTAGIGLYLLQQLARLYVVLVDAVDDLGDDLVLQGIATQLAMVAVPGKPLLV